jgi:hypothetical protein
MQNKNMQNKYLTKTQREEFSLSQNQKEILKGCILGDLHIEKQKGSVNTRLTFKQSTNHTDYLLDLYEKFKEFCPKGPTISTHTLKNRPGKVYSSIRFRTYSLPCFNELHDPFYLDGRKIVPQNIAEQMSPLVLAY